MKQIGIITALIPEAACIVKQVPEPETIQHINENICLIVSGMGAERARSAAELLIASGVDVLVSLGTAGALQADLQPGDLIIPEMIIAGDGRTYQTAKYWRTSVVNKLTDCPGDIYLGRLADTMHVLTTVADKFEEHQKNSAMAVDMESAAIVEAAAKKEIPTIVIRVISDSSTMTVPELVMKISDPYGRVSISKLLTQLITHPAQIPDLCKLAAGFKKSAKSLRIIGRQLGRIFRDEQR